jgi:hypothetical protein
MTLFRHGDVLLQRSPALPEGAAPLPGHVLVRGEVSGHAHRLEDPNAGSLFHAAAGFFLEVRTPTRIVHEEHAPIPLEPGVYRFWQQREYTPREIRTVVD